MSGGHFDYYQWHIRDIVYSLEDYIYGHSLDEEGNIDFSECDLKKAVEENIRLPNINGWDLDNFEVIPE